MKKHIFSLLLLLPVAAFAQSKPDKPSGNAPLLNTRNVILIIADDLGSDYCGFYENHIDTAPMPNVRRLLSRGVRFTNAWSNPICSPTRAGILTGRYSFRTGVGDGVGPGTPVLDTAEITIPRLLNKYALNGIAKANIGKWHLHNPTPASNYLFPNLMGYDHYQGNYVGQVPDYFNWKKITNGQITNVSNYATTECTNDAINWIQAQQDKPFFLWLAYNAPHTPLHLPPVGLHSYTNLSGEASDIAANPKAYFKASLEALDHEIGRLFDSLQAQGLWENTDIIFIGDNGDDPAVAQNTGGAKGSINQEGISVPFVVSGPSVVDPGRVSAALVNTQDLFATILELFGYNDWQGQIPAGKPVDSRSLMPILTHEAAEIRGWAFSEVFRTPATQGDGKTMRNKDYKLLDYDNGTQKFYKISSDPTENNNLLSSQLDAVQLQNYQYLCTEMSNLTGLNGFCVATVDTEEANAEKGPLAFPNPFTDQIGIRSGLENARADLYDSRGQCVFSGKNISKQHFAGLPNGVYCLKIGAQSIRLSKQ